MKKTLFFNPQQLTITLDTIIENVIKGDDINSDLYENPNKSDK